MTKKNSKTQKIKNQASPKSPGNGVGTVTSGYNPYTSAGAQMAIYQPPTSDDLSYYFNSNPIVREYIESTNAIRGVGTVAVEKPVSFWALPHPFCHIEDLHEVDTPLVAFPGTIVTSAGHKNFHDDPYVVLKIVEWANQNNINQIYYQVQVQSGKVSQFTLFFESVETLQKYKKECLPLLGEGDEELWKNIETHLAKDIVNGGVTLTAVSEILYEFDLSFDNVPTPVMIKLWLFMNTMFTGRYYIDEDRDHVLFEHTTDKMLFESFLRSVNVEEYSEYAQFIQIPAPKPISSSYTSLAPLSGANLVSGSISAQCISSLGNNLTTTFSDDIKKTINDTVQEYINQKYRDLKGL